MRRMWRTLCVALALPGVALAKHPDPVAPVPKALEVYGPTTTELDLLRAGHDEGSRTRIFVQAVLPDGSLGLFMVDTGAAISALSEDTAERLGLQVERDWSMVEGLGGRSALHHAVIPSIQLGDDVIPDVDVAVGVAGLPENAGFMPLDGILGNNVWGRFAVEIDYPAERMVLHAPGSFKMPKSSDILEFTEGKIQAPIVLTTATDPPYSGRSFIQLDTGASGLMLAGPDALPFVVADPSAVYSEGVEPVFGIGAADTMPTSAFLRYTRRVPIAEIELGGRKEKLAKTDPGFEARWINYDRNPVGQIGPQGLAGLAGHELFADYDAIFDYQGQRFALVKSKRKAREIDGHAVLLAQDEAKYGDDPSRDLFRAKMHAAIEDYDGADKLLTAFLGQQTAPTPKDAGEARVLLAAVRRLGGDLEGAWNALAPMSPAELVEQGEIIAAVNGLLLDGRNDEALALADAAIAGYGPAKTGDDYEPAAEASARVARADVLLAFGKTDEANGELLNAAQLLDNPDAHLLRRARIALARGDRYGAMAHIRRLLQLYPSNGQYLWFYATLVGDQGPDADTFKADMAEAMDRLHREDRPLDYMVIAEHLLGDQDQAKDLMQRGLERDCAPIEDEANRDNCTAWYYAMAGVEPDEALTLIDRALELEGDRSDFLDTKAMVLLSRGDWTAAHDAAVAAARLSPDEVYMLWQAERIGAIAAEHGGTSTN
jgi:hypothetical protein